MSLEVNVIKGLLLITCVSRLWTMGSALLQDRTSIKFGDKETHEFALSEFRPRQYIINAGRVRKSVRILKEKDGLINIYDMAPNGKPTNSRRVYIVSKTGLYLAMSATGELRGTSNPQSDPNVVFVIESMSRGIVRIKGATAGKYICMSKSQRIVAKRKPLQKCLFHQWHEENNYELFSSYKYSKRVDGQDGWLLALNKSGRVRKPSMTRVGDPSTMFHLHFVGPS